MGRDSTPYLPITSSLGISNLFVPLNMSVSYVFTTPCESSQKTTCIDGSFYAQLKYQYHPSINGSPSYSSIGGQLGTEADIYFSSQRSIAWISQLGLGYSFFTYHDLVAPVVGHNDYLAYYLRQRDGFPYDMAESIQHRFTASLSTGVLFHLPRHSHFSLYALLTLTTTIAAKPIMSYVSLQLAPAIGVRYRF